MDRNSLNRIEIEIIINLMSTSVHNLHAKIQRLIEWKNQLNNNNIKTNIISEQYYSLNAYELCLMEQNIICNQHLPLQFHCVCHVVPHLKHVNNLF